MSQQYSLRWNNHQPNFISMFTTLLNTQTLVDVTLAAEGKHLQAHKVVLSACSTYFQSLFVDNPSRYPIVILKDVSFADLRTMVDFMYYGEVHVTEAQLPKVLNTAKLLKIKGLTEMPESTSVTRSQGTSSEFQGHTDFVDHSISPSVSPSNKKKRRRKSSTGSTTCLNMEDNRQPEEANQSLDLVRGDSITLSSVPEKRRDFQEERLSHDNAHQSGEAHNLNVEPLSIENTVGLAHGGQWSMMEQTYPRYSNCVGGGGGLQADHSMYINNVMNPHMEMELGEYGAGLCVAGPSPGSSCANTAPAPDAACTTTKRRRTSNPQAEERFQKALEAVRSGGIGFCKAARLFGVNNRTLWLEYKKKGYPNNRPSIKSRIKREHTTPPLKDEPIQQEQQMALLCPPPPMPVSFIDSRPLDFPLQGGRMRRAKVFKRQNRVAPHSEDHELRKQASEPLPATAPSTLQKHHSYPQFSAAKNKRPRLQEQEVGSLLIRAVALVDRQPSTSGEQARASHTPAVRSGPPLSCNFCWNTVDECGRILRRKTQYHCPECRTNLCIVPCFHEYHDGPEPDSANAR